MLKKTAPSETDPTTIEATLLWIFPNRTVALCTKGVLYHWEVRASKVMQEGDLVFVHYDKIAGTVYSITPVGDQDDLSAASEDV